MAGRTPRWSRRIGENIREAYDRLRLFALDARASRKDRARREGDPARFAAVRPLMSSASAATPVRICRRFVADR